MGLTPLFDLTTLPAWPDRSHPLHCTPASSCPNAAVAQPENRARYELLPASVLPQYIQEEGPDLVKNHLMYAVREEVEILKEQIKELAEKNNQLERENSLLKNLASPEQLEKFQSRLPSDEAQLPESQPSGTPDLGTLLCSGSAV
ncbi:hypothetical protein COCON_G00046250 [Conger conger]|uniref:TSC22 domain family protein 3 n=1 Tax=Conger conger TaxID=82655 RepID=A0A9Q1I535_CONCO|nr:hypothetical protein COCON_G00046250 [Conger conger]